MRSPLRWFKRWRELNRHAPDRRKLQNALTTFFGYEIVLKPAATKGGYDEIYEVRREGKLFAMARINSSFKTQNDPIGPLDPGVPLHAAGRLQREWEAYSKLSPQELSPKPIWQSENAIVSEWLDMERVSTVLAGRKISVWDVLKMAFPAIAQMHTCGVTHLDLNLGNLLISRDQKRIVIIDFEFGPCDWVTTQQQQAYDYLRLIDDCLKKRRGGDQVLANPDGLVPLLEEHVTTLARQTDLAFVFEKLHRLKDAPTVQQQLGKVFPGLVAPKPVNQTN